MARKPVHLTMTPAKVTGRQAVWQAARRLKQFTLVDLWHASKEERGTIRTYLTALERGGYVAVIEKREKPKATLGLRSKTLFKEQVYQLVRDVGIEAPRLKRDGTPSTQGIGREQMWRTMKMIGDFNFRDLAVAATTEAMAISESDAGDYARHLHRAGYLTLVAKATHKSPAVYRFIKAKNTGPRAPMVQRLKSIFDPNTRTVVWSEEPTE